MICLPSLSTCGMKMTSESTEHSYSKRGLLPSKTTTVVKRNRFVGCVLVLVCSSIIAYIWFWPSNKINFQEYAPVWMPSGQQITTPYLGQWLRKPPQQSPVELDYDANSYTVRETRNNGEVRAKFEYKCTGILSTGDTCGILKSRRSQPYRLTFIQSSSSPYQIVEWLRGNTLITCFLHTNNTNRQAYSSDTIGQFIDSFTQIRYSNLKVKIYNEIPPPGV